MEAGAPAQADSALAAARSREAPLVARRPSAARAARRSSASWCRLAPASSLRGASNVFKAGGSALRVERALPLAREKLASRSS